MHKHVHGSTVRNSQKVETAQVSINRQVGRQIMGIQWDIIQPEKNKIDTCYKVDEPGEHLLRESSQTQNAMYPMIPFRGNIQNRSIHRDRMQTGGCQGQEVEWGSGRRLLHDKGFYFGILGMFWN